MARLPEPVTALGDVVAPAPPRMTAQIDTRRIDTELEPARATIAAGGAFEGAANELDTINTLKAEEAFNTLRQKQMDLTIGPQNGFANVRGSEAIDPKFIPGARERFADATREVNDTLTNDRQRRLFQQRAKVSELQYNEQLLAHVHAENNTFQQQTNQAVINTEIQSIASNYQDPKAIALSNVRIAAAIDREATRLGWSPEEKQQAVQHAQDAAWTARLHAQMVNDPVGALKNFQDGKADISPNLRESLFTKLKQAALPVEAKNAAAAIIGGEGMAVLQGRIATGGPEVLNQAVADGVRAAPYGSVSPGGPGAPGLPPTGSKFDIKAGFMGWVQQAEAIAQKQHPDDPVYRDLLVQNVKSHMNTLITMQDGLARQAHAALIAAATPQPGGPPPPLVLDQLLSTPELRNAWNQSDPGGQRGILALLEHNARQANGLPIRTNPVVFDSVWKRINLPYDDPHRIRTPGQIAPYLAHGLNRTDYDWFRERIDEAQTPDGQRLSEVRKMFLEQARQQFDSSTMLFHDSKGKNDNYNFWQYATNKEREFRVAGKDPYQLYNPDPKNPDYLGRSIPGFQRPLEQRINDMAADLERSSGGQPPGAFAPPAIAPATPAPGPSAPQSWPEGTTATNPVTKEKLVFRGDKWQPTK